MSHQHQPSMWEVGLTAIQKIGRKTRRLADKLEVEAKTKSQAERRAINTTYLQGMDQTTITCSYTHQL